MCATIGRLAARIRRRRCSIYSRDRGGEHPRGHLAGYAGIMQADAYAGYNKLYEAKPQAGADHRGGLLEPRPPQVLRPARESGQRRRSPSRRCGASTRCSRSSASINGITPNERACGAPGTSRAAGRRSGSLDARSSARKLSRQERYSPRRSTTCSTAGQPSPASSTTAASACPTMPPNARCAASRCLSHCASLLQVSVNIGIVSVVSDATRATFSGDRSFDRSDAKSIGADLVWRAGHNLLRGQHAGFDQAAYRVACDA